MAATHYELFQKEFEFKGKHARMASELWSQNDYEHSYFKRLIDLYCIAPIIGFRMNRKAGVDNSSSDTKSIFGDQMRGEKDNLDFALQMILMLEAEEQGKSQEEILKIGFQSIETKEQFDAYNNLFNDYVRGGVEELYERLVVHQPEIHEGYHDEKTTNIMALIERFSPKSA